MGQKRYTLSRGAIQESEIVSATDASLFTGDVRLIIKDTASKAEIINLIKILTNNFLVGEYPF